MAAAYEGEDALWDRRLKRAIAAAMLKLPGDHDPVVIAAACQATILWELDAQPASRIGQADTAAAARGIAQASRMGADSWQVYTLASEFEAADLREGGVDEKVVVRAQARRQAEPARADRGPMPFEAIPAEDRPRDLHRRSASW